LGIIALAGIVIHNAIVYTEQEKITTNRVDGPAKFR
jgi:multidrug efflux pump subunit AcrB